VTTQCVSATLCAAVVSALAAVRLTVVQEGGLRRAAALLAGAEVRDSSGTGAPDWARRLLRARGWMHGPRRAWLCLPPAMLLTLSGESVLPLIGGALAVPLIGRRLRAMELRKAGESRSDGIIALCGATAGELRAGLQPAGALLAATASTGGLGAAEADVLAAARFGGDVPGALRRAAREPGAEGLVGLAACWRVAVDSGAGLAAGLDRLEAALRTERDQRDGLRAQLSGAWSTVVLLALLPVVGLLMGWALGADPFGVLLHTPAGLGCLLAGGLLESAGLWWAARIVRSGEAP
jgi:tight adherence protein B